MQQFKQAIIPATVLPQCMMALKYMHHCTCTCVQLHKCSACTVPSNTITRDALLSLAAPRLPPPLQTTAWAESQLKPGRYTGQVKLSALTVEDHKSGTQAWAKKASGLVCACACHVTT